MLHRNGTTETSLNSSLDDLPPLMCERTGKTSAAFRLDHVICHMWLCRWKIYPRVRVHMMMKIELIIAVNAVYLLVLIYYCGFHNVYTRHVA